MFPHALRWLLTYEAAAKSKATQQNIVESTPSAIQASSEKRCAETARAGRAACSDPNRKARRKRLC
jgi:hypothetical protein